MTKDSIISLMGQTIVAQHGLLLELVTIMHNLSSALGNDNIPEKDKTRIKEVLPVIDKCNKLFEKVTSIKSIDQDESVELLAN